MGTTDSLLSLIFFMLPDPSPFIFLYDDDFLCETENLTRELSGTFQL